MPARIRPGGGWIRASVFFTASMAVCNTSSEPSTSVRWGGLQLEQQIAVNAGNEVLHGLAGFLAGPGQANQLHPGRRLGSWSRLTSPLASRPRTTAVTRLLVTSIISASSAAVR